MKLQKRSSGEPEQTPSSEQQEQTGGKKPVVIYIFVLFLVALILIGISFIMHQRSNTEAIGKLQNSVSALQEVQAAQDKNMKLQEELDEAIAQQEELQEELDEAAAGTKSAQGRADAMTALYTLLQQYAVQDFDACKKTIASMEEDGLDKLLPAESEEGVTSPAQRYLQLREVIGSK